MKRFVAAYLQAFHEVIAHPQEAVDIVAKANPEYADKKDVLLGQLEADIKSTFNNEDSNAHGLGSMTNARWQQTLSTLKEQGVLKVDVAADSVYADKFLPTAK